MKTIDRQWKLTIGYALLLIAVSSALFYPIVTRMVAVEHDYIVHIERAAMLLKSPALSPHLLFQLTTLLVFFLLPINIYIAGTITTLLFYSLTAIVLFYYLKSATDSTQWGIATLAITLMIAMPVPALYPADGHLYFGYIGLNVLHNPTMIVLKPLALLLYILSERILIAKQPRAISRLIVLCGLLSVLAAFAKPNFTICFLPALILFLAYSYINKKPISWKLASCGFLIPSMGFLVLQYLISYDSIFPDAPRFYENSSIIFAPLTVMSIYSKWLAPKFLLSVAFPLLVFIFFAKAAINDVSIIFAWMNFAFGAFYTYFFAESGGRMMQANFFWSGQITLFILFAASTRFLLRQCLSHDAQTHINPTPTWKIAAVGTVLALHIISGAVYYVAEFIQPQRYW